VAIAIDAAAGEAVWPLLTHGGPLKAIWPWPFRGTAPEPSLPPRGEFWVMAARTTPAPFIIREPHEPHTNPSLRSARLRCNRTSPSRVIDHKQKRINMSATPRGRGRIGAPGTASRTGQAAALFWRPL